MSRIRIALLAAALAAASSAQQLKIDLDHLASKSSDSVDLSLNKEMIQFAGKFLNNKDPDEAKAAALISGLDGIYIKSFEFDKDGMYTQADLDAIRNQLKGPDWSRIVGVRSADKEHLEVWVKNTGGKVAGIAVIAAEPRELTVVNIVGNISLDALSQIGGQFGIPKLKVQPEPPKKNDP